MCACSFVQIRVQCKHIYKKWCLAQSRSESIQIPSRTQEFKHPIFFDPGEILPKDYSIMPVKWPFIQSVPKLHRLWCSQTHGGSPVTSAAPLQGAHTRLLPPAGDDGFHGGGSEGRLGKYLHLEIIDTWRLGQEDSACKRKHRVGIFFFKCDEQSFCDWLRKYNLKVFASTVHFFSGRSNSNSSL